MTLNTLEEADMCKHAFYGAFISLIETFYGHKPVQ